MSNAEVGLFIRLLCLQAEHGSIPDDVERIVRAYGEEARTLWAGVKPKFNRGSTEGTLVNERLCEVLAARDEFRKRQSEKGKASAAIRALGSTKPKKRFNRGSTVVEPLGDGDIVLTQKGKERAHEPEVIPAGVSTELWDAIQRWRQYRVEMKKKLTPSGIQSVTKRCVEMGDARAIAAIDHSIFHGYQGIYEERKQVNHGQTSEEQRAANYERILAERYPNG